MKNINPIDIFYRFKRASFSFNFKQSSFDAIIFFYYSFFNYFETPLILKKIIKFLSKFSYYRYQDLIRIQKERLELKNKENFIFKIKQSQIKSQQKEIFEVRKLIEDGYVDISNYLDVDHMSFMRKINDLKAYNSQVPIQSNHKLSVVDENFNYYSLRPDLKILEKYYVQALKNPSLKKIIMGYLGEENYIYTINTMISMPSKKKHSVTNLHRDYDDISFLALAIYWTDVEEDDGATYFVPKTHNSYIDQKNKLIDKGHYLKGKAGSAYLMDTYGWHAGNKNLKKKRVVTWIRFSKNQLNVASFDNKEHFFFNFFNKIWK